MQRQRLSQRVLSLLLAFMIALSCAPAAFAESTEAAMMRLMKTEGTVAITNGKGRSVTVRDNLRLNSGYGLKTEEASYAWINLDDAKLVKEDAVSAISIRKSGKKLDILLDSGNLFFNVSKPLEEDESFTIRTSTMAVGIRGTCGWVKVIDQWTTQVFILEGSVTVTVTDPVTGETKTETVRGGETVICKVYPQDQDGSKAGIIRQPFKEDEIEGFVLVELVKDRPLCEKIYEDSGLDILGSGINPEQKLKEDQEAVHEKLKPIQDGLEQQEHNVSKDPVWTDPEPEGTAQTGDAEDAGYDNGGGSGGTVIPTDTLRLTMPQTAAAVNEALGRANVREVVLLPGTRARASTAMLLDVDSALTVPGGKALTLQSGVGLTAGDGRMLAVQGTLTVSGDFRLSGDLAAGSQGTIKSTAFKLAASVLNWKVSSDADSAGYYTLTYSPQGVYTVTFNANGGAVSPTQMKTGTDSRLTSLPTPTRSGYAFDGWYTAAAGGTQITTATVFTSDTTVYAHWAAGGRYTVTFDPTGGNVMPTSSITDAGGRLSSTAEIPDIPADAAPFNGNFYKIYRTTLNWEDAKAYCEQLDGHLASVTSAEEQSFLDSLNANSARLWIGGYRDDNFNWFWVTGEPWGYTNWADGEPNDSGNVVSNENRTALWPRQWNDLNENNRSEQSGFVCEWEVGAVLPTPTREGYTFNGWFTAAEGGTQVTTATVFTRDTTIYAHWTSAAASGDGWRYDPNTKVLYITGSGPMQDYGAATTADGSTVTNAPWDRFRSQIVAVVISDGITSIGENAFIECSNLVTADIPASVASVNRYAFFDSNSLKDVYYGGTEEQWSKVSVSSGNQPLLNAIIHCMGGNHMVDGGDAGENVKWSYDGTTKVLRIWGAGPMEDYTISASGSSAPWMTYAAEMWSLVVETGVTRLGNYAFHGCTGLTSVELPTSLTTIGEYSFSGCTNLTSISIPDSVTTVALGAFTRTGLTSAVIPGSVVNLGNGVFNSSTKLVSVEFGNGITSISTSIFMNCTSLTSITIPVSVTAIDRAATYGCTKLTDVYYGGTRAQWNALLPNIGTSNDPLLNATIHCTDDAATSGVTWRYDEATKTLYIEGSGPMDDYSVESKVTTAPWSLYATEMQSVVIENGVTSIGRNAFYNCITLSSITLPDSVTSIDSMAFGHCDALTSITIPRNVTSIPDHMCYESTGLTSVVITGSITSIGEYAFSGCESLASINFPDGLTSIDVSAFSGCKSLTDIVLPDSVTSIKTAAFERCSGLRNLTLPNGITQILYATFSGCHNLESVSIPDSVTYIGAYAFYSCLALSDVSIPSSVTTIGSFAFNSTNISSIFIPSGVTLVETWAFANCKALTAINVDPANANYTSEVGVLFNKGKTELRQCPAGQTGPYVIPSSVTTIDRGAFERCAELTSVTIPASVTDIGNQAFFGCSTLADVYYGGTETQWNAVTIGSNNTPLTSATMHYNATARSAVSYSAPGYTDVPSTASYAEAVRYCQENNLMTGTSATEFTPDGTLTRAMMVTVLHRLAGKPFAYATASFADVQQGKWYTEAISWASGQGIVNGYNPTTFGPNDPVTHEQVGLILQRYSGDPGVEVTGGESPKTPATRAEIAMTLMNYAKNRKPGTLSEASAINVMCAPSGIVLDKDGNLLVTDVYGKQLWHVQNRNGTAYAGGATVQDLYGQPLGGYNDAGLTDSFFKEPWAIAPFLDGWAVSDTANNVVRLVSGSAVQTLNGATHEQLKVTDLGVAFDGPTGLASDDDGSLYVSDTLNGAVRRVSPKGGVVTVAKNLSDPTGLCWKDGALYIAETGKNRIVKLEKGKVTVVAGSGAEGLTDGGVQQAAFSSPKGVTVGADGSIYVADTGNGAVRVVRGGTVTTLAVRDPEHLGSGLMSPTGLLVRGNSLYICDTFARKIFVYQLS